MTERVPAKRDRVFADTNTLFPISVADFILRLAEERVIELVWTEDLLAEVERVLVERKSLTSAQSRYFCDCIRGAFPSGRLDRSSYDHLIETRVGPDPDDRVHSAAVVGAAVDVLLSSDKTGFPAADIAPARRVRPDAYACELLAEQEDVVIETIRQMAVGRRAPVTPTEILAALRSAGLAEFSKKAAKLIG